MSDLRQSGGLSLQGLSTSGVNHRTIQRAAGKPAVEQPVLVRVPSFGLQPVRELVERLRRPGGDVENFVLGFLQRGISAEAVLLDLFAPAARQLGDMWVDDSCSFVDVTLASGRLQHLIHVVSDRFLAPVPSRTGVGRILLSVVPGEQHSLGLIMLGEFFRREGWDLTLAPLGTASNHLMQMVTDEWFDVVALSVACDDHLPSLRCLVRDLRRNARNREVRVLVGGRIFDEEGQLAGRLGADGFAPDATAAVQVASKLL